jgi:ABC-type sugar transport system permease subunit
MPAASVNSGGAPSIEGAHARLQKLGAILVGPAVVLVVAVNVLPAFFGFYSSLRKIFFFTDEGFVGLDNFAAIFSEANTYAVIGRSFVFTFGSLALSIPLALMAALVVRQFGRNGRIFLTMLLVPWAMSPIVVSLLWKWILLPSPGGLLASVFMAFGWSPIAPLTDPAAAMPTIIAVGVWRNFAFAAIILTAGLGQIPDDLYKAAAVDGLTVFERFWRITLPLLTPSLLIVLCVLTISYFNEVQVIIGLTGGGPINATTTLAYQLYQTGFVELDQGRGNAIAVVMFLINIGLVVAYVRLLGGGSEERT